MKTTNAMIWIACLSLAACGTKHDGEAPPKPTPKPSPKPTPASPEPPPAPAKPIPAPIDPATFVAVDLSSVPPIANATVKAPPGATVTADAPEFGEDAASGAVIAAGEFAVHVWRGTTGGERTARPLLAKMQEQSYVETTHTPDLTEYTLEVAGKKTFGFFRPIDGFVTDSLTDAHAQLLCGPAHELATAEQLAPYRAACDSITKVGTRDAP